MVCLSLFITLLAHANTVEKLDHFIYLGLEEWVELETTIATNTKHTTTKIATAVIFITANNIKVTDTSNPVGILEAVPSTYIRSNHFAFRPLIHYVITTPIKRC